MPDTVELAVAPSPSVGRSGPPAASTGADDGRMLRDNTRDLALAAVLFGILLRACLHA